MLLHETLDHEATHLAVNPDVTQHHPADLRGDVQFHDLDTDKESDSSGGYAHGPSGALVRRPFNRRGRRRSFRARAAPGSGSNRPVMRIAGSAAYNRPAVDRRSLLLKRLKDSRVRTL